MKTPWILLSAVLLAARAFAVAPATINFQGVLKTPAGSPVADGTHSVTFTLYNGAGSTNTVTGEPHETAYAPSFTLFHATVLPGSDVVMLADHSKTFVRGTDYTIDNANGIISRVSGGSIPDLTSLLVNYTWSTTAEWTETQSSVQTVKGSFVTLLGKVSPLPSGPLFDKSLFLAVAVGSDPEMTPRIPFASVPYASGLSLPVSASGSSGTSALTITNTNTGYTGTGITGYGSDTGIHGQSTDGIGVGVQGNGQIGVVGVSDDGEYGVYGSSMGGQGTGVGVFGLGDTGDGVYGANGPQDSFSGLTAGVVGYSRLTDGSGVAGQAFDGTNSKGVQGETRSGFGGYFTSFDNTGIGAYGKGIVGLKGETSMGGGLTTGGVIGQSTASNGNGVVGIASGSGAFAVWGSNPTGQAGHFDGNVAVSGTVGIGSSFAARGTQNLRIVSGVVNTAGSVFSGAGYTSTRSSTGKYVITFSPAFSGVPAMTVTPNTTSLGYTTGVVTTISTANVSIGLGTTLTDLTFHFIAIGPA